MRQLVIEDDGVGFDPSERDVARDKGLGLIGMRERAALVGADAEVESSPERARGVPAAPDRSRERRDGSRDEIRVLLADDHETVRQGLRLLIDAQADMEVVGEAADGRAARRARRRAEARTSSCST